MPITIKDVPFFRDLSPVHLDAVRNCLIEKSFEKGDIIHSEGNDCTRLFFVQSGRVKIYRTSSSGKEQIFEILGPGDTCACNPGNVSWFCTSNAEAITPSKVWFLSRENYVRMVRENSTLMHALNELFAKRLQCFGNIIEEVSLKDTKKRLIKFLLDMLNEKKKGLPNSNILFINSTREEISHRLGTARETIARHLSELKRKKLIDIKPYQIIIRDKEALEKLLL
ncbi:MAG: Crp/Fnr family transcriptional regulator [Candidatus Omnitrophica bacterium]|nr:Crp/Fnr family transcriptional regulator [Candidatus Omnitrophota bacterium]